MKEVSPPQGTTKKGVKSTPERLCKNATGANSKKDEKMTTPSKKNIPAAVVVVNKRTAKQMRKQLEANALEKPNKTGGAGKDGLYFWPN